MLRFASLIYNLRHLRSMFAEELLKIKLACLFAISSFRRFWKHQRRLRPSPVMIAETISLACFVLLVVVFCCVIKIYTMVKNIRPSRNERLCVDYARDNQRALPVEREPTFYFPQAERGARQHGIRNNATYSGSQAIRRQPQMNDERFGWQSKKNVSYSSAQLEFFFVFTAFNHSSSILSFAVFLVCMWYCVHHFHGGFRLGFITSNWRVLD